MRHFDILIVGAGHAGAQAAITLRQLGFSGSVGLIGAEEELPYERPPLSKEYFAGEKSFDRLLLRPREFWLDRDIETFTGLRVDTIDVDRKRVGTSRPDEVGYAKTIGAAGGPPRLLTCPGADAGNVHVIRQRRDVDRIRAQLDRVSCATIVGGGYIGLEAASVLTKLGKQVVLLEAQERVLERVAGEELSRFFEEEHRRRGVDLRTSAGVEAIETDAGTATAVLTREGERIATDMLIVGIGIVPEIGPLASAGAAVGDGVHVDEYCRTSLADIYAVGDCASHINAFANGARIRLESIQNAHDQAKTVAAHIVGTAASYHALPWFWSNQFDLKLQTAGISRGHDQTVMRGDPARGSFSLLYLRQGRLIALDCVNSVKDYVQGRTLILSGALLNSALLANDSIALKDIAPT
jgi:3-phenylpropionate/trans-cinnamate dioxygenase ferredoxin reductase subunit